MSASTKMAPPKIRSSVGWSCTASKPCLVKAAVAVAVKASWTLSDYEKVLILSTVKMYPEINKCKSKIKSKIEIIIRWNYFYLFVPL